eukprot:1296911-Pleurochrysis_carterae.AAC.1
MVHGLPGLLLQAPGCAVPPRAVHCQGRALAPRCLKAAFEPQGRRRAVLLLPQLAGYAVLTQSAVRASR